ncbi:hypothetical protein [Spongiactinospora sp. TRM90649]|uniref:hypothetical protein n=1 Tax=Spongiactinospora sp. TRM90649 TaxID=3031114 RepID=UPI0023F6D623|nr:hypothetical protein [Spongiactinospora sp. TRM90649]MDF5752878.1 hypothetical protein [Spongiactinospora sp. TRM90649]
MRASIVSYHLHKGGGSASEYEDAHAIYPEDSRTADVYLPGFRVAISDGASESALAGRWAQLLVGHFVTADPDDVIGSAEGFAYHVASAAKMWSTTVGEYVAARAADGRPIRWYEQPKIDKGAYATLLTIGFTAAGQECDILDPVEEVTWTAAAIGDCVLFHVRDEELLTAFPMSASADFGTSPALLSSRTPNPALVADRVTLRSGRVRTGDDVFLCTDAVGAWFLAETERGRRPWQILRDLSTGEGPDFDELVRRQRSSRRMRNDDATLVHVDVW